MDEQQAVTMLIAVACLSPLAIASWLLKRRIQTSPPDITPGRRRTLNFGVSLGFVSCVSVVGLFLLSRLWDPPGSGSIEAPNTLLALLALLGNLCNLCAMAASLISWSKQGFVAFVLLATNQVIWLFLGFLIIAAHGF